MDGHETPVHVNIHVATTPHIDARSSDPHPPRNLKAAKGLGMQTIREGPFLQHIRGSQSTIPLLFCIGVPIGGSHVAIKSLEVILGVDLGSISAKWIDADVGGLTSMSKL